MLYCEHLITGNFRVNHYTCIPVLLTSLDCFPAYHMAGGEDACDVSWEWSERQAMTTEFLLGEAAGEKST